MNTNLKKIKKDMNMNFQKNTAPELCLAEYLEFASDTFTWM